MKERVVCLVSGGIDSPVACALAAKKFDVVPLHFCTYPYTSEEMFGLTMNALKKLEKVAKFEKIVLYPWAGVLKTIVKKLGRREYTCLICKKSMFKAAELVCKREGAGGIVTGESLGQKASQTLSNLGVTSHGVKIPILRPLLGFDKLEIEKTSKELGIWQERHAGVCNALPKHPRTRAIAGEVDELFNQLNVNEPILKNFRKTMEVRTFKEDLHSYLMRCKRYSQN